MTGRSKSFVDRGSEYDRAPLSAQANERLLSLIMLTLHGQSTVIHQSPRGTPSCRLRYTRGVMNRRQFLSAGAAGLGLAGLDFAQSKPLRVGLIGCGWYGKTDLLRMIQVSPVEV